MPVVDRGMPAGWCDRLPAVLRGAVCIDGARDSRADELPSSDSTRAASVGRRGSALRMSSFLAVRTWSDSGCCSRSGTCWPTAMASWISDTSTSRATRSTSLGRGSRSQRLRSTTSSSSLASWLQGYGMPSTGHRASLSPRSSRRCSPPVERLYSNSPERRCQRRARPSEYRCLRSHDGSRRVGEQTGEQFDFSRKFSQ